MKLVIVGGVAAGATAAARARRISEDAEITLFERGPYVSYANCGLPYFLSGDIANRSDLLLQTPAGFWERYRVDVQVDTDVTAIDRAGKRVQVKGPDGDRWVSYDKLILAQGGQPVMPRLPGSDSPHVFRLWTVPDMDRLQHYLSHDKPRSAVVVGGGFIGLEMAEAFRKRGLAVTVVELLPSVMAVMDPEFGKLIAHELSENGVQVVTGVGVQAVLPDDHQVELSDGRRLPADLVLFSVGVRPDLQLAKDAGLTIGPAGGLQVDETLRTSDPDIFASGDMVEVHHRIADRIVRLPLAGPANRQGRIAASNALGMTLTYPGVTGTSAVKIFEATAAMTGLSEKMARDAGFAVGVATVHKDHHAAYYPGAEEITLKLIYDRDSHRLLGGQAFGKAGVDKRIDVLATALQGRMTLEDLASVDLAYAPPYSSANDPLNIAAFVGLNDCSGFSPLVTPADVVRSLDDPHTYLLDVRRLDEYREGHVRGAHAIPIDDLRDRLGEIPRSDRVIAYCRSGQRSHLAVRILKEHGFENVAHVTGGYLSLEAAPDLPREAAEPVETKS